MPQGQDFLTSITFLSEARRVQDYCLPVRHRDTTERTAKNRATRRAKAFGLIPQDTKWKHRQTGKQTSSRAYRDPSTGKTLTVIVQRVSKLTRNTP